MYLGRDITTPRILLLYIIISVNFLLMFSWLGWKHLDWLDTPESGELRLWTPVISNWINWNASWFHWPRTSLKCSSVSFLINMEPLELLRLQPSEPIASESVASSCHYGDIAGSALQVTVWILWTKFYYLLNVGIQNVPMWSYVIFSCIHMYAFCWGGKVLPRIPRALVFCQYLKKSIP